MVSLAQLNADDVRWAIDQLDGGLRTEYGEPKAYVLVVSGRQYAPKEVAGVAASRVFGRVVTPSEFSSGIGVGHAVSVLRELGFDVVPLMDLTGVQPHERGSSQPRYLASCRLAPGGNGPTRLCFLKSDLESFGPKAGADVTVHLPNAQSVSGILDADTYAAEYWVASSSYGERSADEPKFAAAGLAVGQQFVATVSLGDLLPPVAAERHEIAIGADTEDAIGVRYVPAATSSLSEIRMPVVDIEAIERGLEGHVSTQNALAEFLRARDIEPLSPKPGGPRYDVAWSVNGTHYVAEVKSTTSLNEESQLRLGLGQLLRYRFKLANQIAPVVAVLVPERKPTDPEWLELCAELGVIVVWPSAFESLPIK